jgi:hypothetical protein
MPKMPKTFKELHPHEETKFEPLSKKQKLRDFDTKGRSKVSSNLKNHFPDRIWNVVNEKKKGPKV